MVGFPPPPDKRVDRLDGLWTAPYNHWAYQNMRRLTSSAGFARADTPVVLPRRIDNRIEHLSVTREDGSHAEFDTFVRETFTDSLVVVQDGAVVYEGFFNGMNGRQPHQMMSCTKSFVGLFALMAVEDGLISEEDLAGDIVVEVSNGGSFSGATLGQILDMTNSMAFHEDYENPESPINDYVRIMGLETGSGKQARAQTLHSYLLTLQKETGVAHGDTFHYQTPKTDMVNWITNRLTGTSLLENMERLLWRKLGTDADAYFLLDRTGTPVAGAGLNAAPNDLARFATMIVQNGEFNGKRILPSSVIDRIAAGGSTEAFAKGPGAAGVFGDGHWSYRGQWWIRSTPGREAIIAIGVNGQWIYCHRIRNVAIVKQSSQPVASSPYFDDYTLNAFDAIIDTVL